MSELQAEAGDFEEVEFEEIAETEQPDESEASELAPEKEEKVSFTEEQQRVIDDIVAKKTYKMREAERQAEEYQRKLADLEAKQPKETRPEVPALPDPYDDDYAEKIRQRDEVIARRVEFDARQRMTQEQERQKAEQAQYQKQKDLEKQVDSYAKRAVQLGVSKEDLAQAGQEVARFGIGDDIATFIIGNDQGPLITKYLAANPTELDVIARLDSISAAVRIETIIKPKAAQLGKRKPTAPDPVETLSGVGANPTKGPKGATFE